MNKDFSTGYLTGLLKPKYRIISNILGENYSPEKGLDIFIDMNTFINSLSSSKKFLEYLPFSETVEEDLISSILMTLKHWRDFSRKYNDVRIIMSFNDFEICPISERDQLKAYLVPYVNKFKNDRYTQMTYYWNEACKIVEPLFDYLPKSYFIRCKKFDSFILPELLSEDRDRLIISGSAMMTSYVFQKNTRMIYSCYRHQGTAQLSDPLMIVQSLTKIDDELVNIFIQNKVFYNLINTIIGDKDRGIIGLTQFGITSFASDLLRSVEKREIPSNPKSIDSVLSVINPNYHDYLKKNYPLMDVTLHAQMIKPSIVEQVKAKLVDKSDIDALMKFTINGLNLLELL